MVDVQPDEGDLAQEADVAEDMQESVGAADRGYQALLKHRWPKRTLGRNLSNASGGSAMSSQSMSKPRGKLRGAKAKGPDS